MFVISWKLIKLKNWKKQKYQKKLSELRRRHSSNIHSVVDALTKKIVLSVA